MSACAADPTVTLTRLLGRNVAPGHVRPWLVAALDWQSNCGDPETDGEGLRALDERERQIALYFFSDSVLMARTAELLEEDGELARLAGDIDPINATAMLVVDDGLDEATAASTYASTFREREHALFRYITSKPPAGTVSPAARRGMPRTRSRAYRVRRRPRATSASAGDSSPGEPAPPRRAVAA